MGDLLLKTDDFLQAPGLRLVRNVIGSQTPSLTFPSERPALALDYIYHTRGLRTEDFNVDHSLASDHLPVVATICLEDDPSRASVP